MLGIVQNFLRTHASPIGVDFGTETLRLAQVSCAPGEETRIVAAASLDVPTTARNDPQQRIQFLISALKELVPAGGFKGKQAVLGLPSSALSMLHLRLPPMDEKAMQKAVAFEARGKLPYDPSHAVIRHLVAGEVYHGQDQKVETILMASPRAAVEALLAAAGKAKLNVVGLNTEPLALLDCMLKLSRRKEDLESTVLYVDIGASGSRALIARGSKVLFARSIGVGGDHFTRAVAQRASLSFEDAKLLRLRMAEATQPMAAAHATESPAARRAAVEPEAGDSPDHSFALLGAAMAKKKAGGTALAQPPVAAASPHTATGELALVEEAVREPLGRLIEELDMCRRYHEATFPAAPVDKLIFVGGEAKQKGLCAHVARELGLAASVGDPVARMAKDFEFPPDSGIDRRGPQPDWAVAIGLSMGPVVKAA